MSELFVSGLITPYGLAFDSAGNLYCANAGNNTILKINTSGSIIQTISGLSLPRGLAFDSAGNLYCANFNNNTISKINTATNTIIQTISGLITPYGLAFDSAGNLYCANFNNNTISKIDTSGSIIQTISGLSGPSGLAFDSQGNLYCANANFNNNTISKINTATNTIIQTISGLSGPRGLAFDSAGNLYCANADNDTISKITPDGSTVSTFLTSNVDRPTFLAISTTYQLYWSNDIFNPLQPQPDSNTIYRTTSAVSCFNEGTKILCLNKNLEEEYIPIENLRKGDFVKTYKHGFKKIELIGKRSMINNPNKWTDCMYKMEKNEKTEENGLIDDLIVTGGHSILVDALTDYELFNQHYSKKEEVNKIDDKCLLFAANSKDFIQLENTDKYTYYHLVLENENETDNNNENEIKDVRYGIWANGVLTETTFKSAFLENHYELL